MQLEIWNVAVTKNVNANEEVCNFTYGDTIPEW